MSASTVTLPDACRSHVDGINKALAAGSEEQALYLAWQYFRARIQKCHRNRPGDADRFRRYATHMLAELAGQVHDHKPGDDYRFTLPQVPGGDWRP